MIEEARNKSRKVHFASLMDLCHLKKGELELQNQKYKGVWNRALMCAEGHCHLQNSELEPQYQKYKGRVVLRGDIVKDDSGSYAVFTEQSHGHYSRLPRCAAQAADAVSADTQVKIEDAPTFLKIPKSECPDIWIRLTKTQMSQKYGPAWKTQSFLLSEIYMVIFLQDCCGEGNLRKSF